MARIHRILTIGTLMVIALVCALGATSPARAGGNVTFADVGGDCSNLVPCFTSIQKAVNGLSGTLGPGEVRVFPGTYSESVDLTTMGSTADHTMNDITLIGVGTANETPSPVAPVIKGEAPIHAADFPFSVTIDGFVIQQQGGDGGSDGIFVSTTGTASITVNNVTSSDADDDGIELKAQGTGDVTVFHVTTNGNGHRGMYLEGTTVNVSQVTSNGNLLADFGDGMTIHAGQAMITDVEADGNADDGIDVEAEGGVSLTDVGVTNNTDGGADLTGDPISILESSAGGNGGIGFEMSGPSSVEQSEASNNGGDGFSVSNGRFEGTDFIASNNGLNGVRIQNEFQSDVALATLIGNGENGLSARGKDDNGKIPSLSVINSIAMGNTNNGILLNNANPGGPFEIHQNILCDNDNGGLDINSPDAMVNAEGNWWGDASGPTNDANPGGTGDQVFDGVLADRGTVDFDQWISKIEASELAEPAAAVGAESTLAFVFTTEDRHWQLASGPGSKQSDGPFTVTTDNGTVRIDDQTGTSVTGRINDDSQLRVGVNADHVGQANISMTGPCRLELERAVGVGETGLKGDIDCNSTVEAPDVARSLRAAAGFGQEDVGDCSITDQTLDINCNGDVEGDGIDPLLILQYIAQVDSTIELPEGCVPVGE